MAKPFKHLDLILQRDGRKFVPPKLKIPVPVDVRNNKANRVQHSGKLFGQANAIKDAWSREEAQRVQDLLPKLSDKKPLLIRISPELIDTDYLRSTFGFEVVCEYEDGLVIVATNPDDFEKDIIKIQAFAEEIKGSGNVAKINDIIVEETKKERLNRILSEILLQSWGNIVASPESSILVEMSIECQGTITIGSKPKKSDDETEEHFNKSLSRWEERRNKAYDEWDELCRQREEDLENIIKSYGGEVLEIFDFIEDVSVLDSFEIKAQISHKCLVDIALNYPYVFEIKQPDEIERGISNMTQVELSNPDFKIIPPVEDAATVCVIDSGIQEGHVYLTTAIKHDLSKCFLPSRSDIVDQVEDGGHGTRVTGAILYPNGVSGISGQYELPCYIANARVLDENCKMPDILLPSKIIGEIVKKYAIENGIRLFNHSIAASYPCLTKYMSSWAATIDNSVYERDIVFIQAAGNLMNDNQNTFRLGVTQHLSQGRVYPNYLLENSCRIPNPAQSMQALTVGAICINEYEDDDWSSFGSRGSVASYSCSGFGLWGAIKPELVEYGGDIIKNKNGYEYRTVSSTCSELIRVSPPAYAKDNIGTSFAAPKVANIVALLQNILPSESALLYRALVVQSARWTTWAESFLADRQKDILRLIGYGLPDAERATTNDEHRITYITTGERLIQAGYVHIYRVKVPEAIRNLHNTIRIDVTLAFSSKPRRTRKGFRGYFATWVDWMTSKFNEDLELFARRILSTPEEADLPEDTDEDRGNGIPWTIGARNNHGVIKGVSRSRSATQKDWAEMEAYQLPKEFCIAVVGHKGWSTNGEHSAKYSLCVSFEAINRDVEIYVPFIEAEASIDVEQEIETEIKIPDIE